MIKSEIGDKYTWKVENFYNLKNIEWGEIIYTIDQLGVTYKVGNYCLYSDEYVKTYFPRWVTDLRWSN